MMKRLMAYIAFYEDDKILLHDKGECKYKWGLFGGGLEEGETIENTLIREVKEELSYELKEGEYEYIGHKNCKYKYEGKEYDGDVYIYVAKIEDKRSQFQLTEGAGMKLIHIEDAKMLDITIPTLEGLELVTAYLENIK